MSDHAATAAAATASAAAGAGASAAAAAAAAAPSSTATAAWPTAAELDARMEAFDRDGYSIIEGALSRDEVTELRATIAALRPVLEASPHRKRLDPSDAHRAVPGLDVRPIAMQPRERADGTTDYPFRKLIDHPTTFPVALRALGHWSVSLLTSHLICSPPTDPALGRNIGWHTDGGIPHFTAADGVKAFQQLKIGVFLVDLLKDDMGSLMVVPGSHKLPAIAHRPAGSPDPDGAIQLKVHAGDAVVFQQGLHHAGAPNYSDQERITIYTGYGARYLRPMDFTPETLSTAFLESCSPVQRQLMGCVSAPLSYYIPADGDVPLKEAYERHFGVAHHRT